MTEAEWLACDDLGRMLRFIAGEEQDPRKLRLYACACCRAVWDEAWPQRCRDVVEVAERFADGLTTEKALNNARSLACQAAQSAVLREARRVTEPTNRVLGPRLTFAGDVAFTDRLIAFRIRIASGKEVLQSDGVWKTFARPLLLDVFGNPFRPVTFLAEWRTSTVLALAEQMYESRDFSVMPILADALQDAGCDRADVLDHCRGPGPHVRGCWVVDLVLGKV